MLWPQTSNNVLLSSSLYFIINQCYLLMPSVLETENGISMYHECLQYPNKNVKSK